MKLKDFNQTFKREKNDQNNQIKDQKQKQLQQSKQLYNSNNLITKNQYIDFYSYFQNKNEEIKKIASQTGEQWKRKTLETIISYQNKNNKTNSLPKFVQKFNQTKIEQDLIKKTQSINKMHNQRGAYFGGFFGEDLQINNHNAWLSEPYVQKNRNQKIVQIKKKQNTLNNHQINEISTQNSNHLNVHHFQQQIDENFKKKWENELYLNKNFQFIDKNGHYTRALAKQNYSENHKSNNSTECINNILTKIQTQNQNFSQSQQNSKQIEKNHFQEKDPIFEKEPKLDLQNQNLIKVQKNQNNRNEQDISNSSGSDRENEDFITQKIEINKNHDQQKIKMIQAIQEVFNYEAQDKLLNIQKANYVDNQVQQYIKYIKTGEQAISFFCQFGNFIQKGETTPIKLFFCKKTQKDIIFKAYDLDIIDYDKAFNLASFYVISARGIVQLFKNQVKIEKLKFII